MFGNITLDKIDKDAKELDIKQDSYLTSYPEFVRYFENVTEFNRHHLVIGIHFVYGWMPTSFEFCSDKFDESVALLEAVRMGKKLSEDELKTLRTLFNNSLVGTSKLLHFINPNQYAIWDSRILRYLSEKDSKPWHYQLNKVDAYHEYIDWGRHLTSKDAYLPIHE